MPFFVFVNVASRVCRWAKVISAPKPTIPIYRRGPLTLSLFRALKRTDPDSVSKQINRAVSRLLCCSVMNDPVIERIQVRQQEISQICAD